MNRRQLLQALPLACLSRWAPAESATAPPAFAQVDPARGLEFPRDHGAHPEFRTEWWYLTGWMRAADGGDFGVQVTFFRNRPGLSEQSKSAFAPTQLLFAHAAIADATHGRLRHDQRVARAGFDLAQAATSTTSVRIGDWSLDLVDGRYVAQVVARGFTLTLNCRPTQPLLLQGEQGVSRKGATTEQRSHYYSQPQLAATGTLELGGRLRAFTGTAWLDHEWSSQYLAAEARGWDWVGLNLDDGGALMVFRMRGMDGTAIWAGGTLRDAQGRRTTLAADAIRFTPIASWRSPRTGVEYPVAFRVVAGALEFELEALLPDQELDTRGSVGTIYWEGAVRASSGGRAIGRGYLELTGYGAPLKL